jgi:hypothetical protein
LQREEERITHYMATARALKTFSGESAEGKGGRLIHALRRPYLEASKSALEAIVDCYRQGTVVTDGGAWRPGEATDSLVHLMGELVTWVSGENESC